MNNHFLNFTMEGQTTSYSSLNDNKSPNDMDPTVTVPEDSFTRRYEGMLSATAPSFTSLPATEKFGISAAQETMAADTTTTSDVSDILYNIRMNSSNIHIDNAEHNNNSFYTDNGRAESLASSRMWSDSASTAGTRDNGMLDTFDFLMKSLSSANSFVSMLTREQLYVLKSIRPSLLYEILKEVMRARNERRLRRALPNECAFCKNNGENEECYGSHSLKDWRGRVLCPVLRAFRCPRCGATGDRAHTIKYCPESAETGSNISGIMGSPRKPPPSSSLLINRTNKADGVSTTSFDLSALRPLLPVYKFQDCTSSYK